jgi:hypothetical protein
VQNFWWRVRLWIAWVFVGTGASFLAIAFCFTVQEVAFLHTSKVTTATVIDTLNHDDGDGVITTCPQFQFRDSEGLTHRVTSHACASPPAFAVGQNVGVRYQQKNPDRAQTDTLGAKWGLVIGFSIPPLVMLPTGFLILRKLKTHGRPLSPRAIFA